MLLHQRQQKLTAIFRLSKKSVADLKHFCDQLERGIRAEGQPCRVAFRAELQDSNKLSISRRRIHVNLFAEFDLLGLRIFGCVESMYFIISWMLLNRNGGLAANSMG